MGSTRTHDVVATIGTYKNNQGEEKKRYINVGSAFTNDNGELSIKLDAVPVSPEWSGWLSLYVPKERGTQQQSRPPQQQTRPASGGGYRKPAVPEQPVDDDGSDIPF